MIIFSEQTLLGINFKICYTTIIVSQTTLLLLILTTLNICNAIFPYLCSFIVDIIILIIHIKSLESRQKLLIYFYLTLDVLFILAKLFSYLYLVKWINFIVVISCFLTIVFLKLIVFFIEKAEDECTSAIKIIVLFCQIIAIIFVVQILLKVTNNDVLSNWSWSDIFWPYWMITAVATVIVLPLGYMFLLKGIQLTQRDQMTPEVKQDYYGIVWILGHSLGLTLFLYIYGMGVVNLLLYKENSLLWPCLYGSIMIIIILQFYTIKQRNTLSGFIQAFQNEIRSQSNQQNNASAVSKPPDRQQGSLFCRISMLNNTNPTVLTRRSGAYYAETLHTIKQSTDRNVNNQNPQAPIKTDENQQDQEIQAELYTNIRQVEQKIETESNLCVVCFDKGSDSVYMPCKHGGLCYECATKQWKQLKCCHICRDKIQSIVEINKLQKPELYKVIAMTVMK
ncbi:hypothetical protein pb186bvf_017166 [Paramecium bursaria]